MKDMGKRSKIVIEVKSDMCGVYLLELDTQSVKVW